jgi:SAM-dependent methyltransferase
MQRPLVSQRERRQIFESVYARKLWGGDGSDDFYSGSGSDPEEVQAYANVIKKFISEYQVRTHVDIGCGDFRAGCAARVAGSQYIGIDIVPSLIERNRRRFSDSEVEFRCIDAVVDHLPAGDLCTIKQVLQHLSNAEISLILRKARKYKYLIVTEHWPAPSNEFSPNRDKPPDGDLRVPIRSGVYPHLPPFSYKAPKILLVTEPRRYYKLHGETITTMLFENDSRQ